MNVNCEATGDNDSIRRFIHRMQFLVPKHEWPRDKKLYRVRILVETVEQPKEH